MQCTIAIGDAIHFLVQPVRSKLEAVLLSAYEFITPNRHPLHVGLVDGWNCNNLFRTVSPDSNRCTGCANCERSGLDHAAGACSRTGDVAW